VGAILHFGKWKKSGGMDIFALNFVGSCRNAAHYLRQKGKVIPSALKIQTAECKLSSS